MKAVRRGFVSAIYLYLSVFELQLTLCPDGRCSDTEEKRKC